MFPIFEEDELSACEICDRWPQESTESWDDTLAFLEGAWWRGEIKWVSGATRLELLKYMFNWARDHSPGRIVFVTCEDAFLPRGVEQPDGGLILDVDDLERPRIIVPSYDPDTWSEESCASAFEALSEKPSLKYYPERSPGFLAMEVDYSAFMQLLTEHGIDLPKFWRLPIQKVASLKQTPDANGARQPSRKESSAVASDMRKRGRRPIKRVRVEEAMKCGIQAGKFTHASLSAMVEKDLAQTFGVSRDTARKARNAVLSEFDENSNPDK
jgi:hypothetical protein